MAVRPQQHLFTVEDYERMGAMGVLTEYDCVELIEGVIYEKMTIGGSHAAGVDRLNDLFGDRLRRWVIVRVQGPVRLPPDSEPEPDISLLRRRDDYYEKRHPGSDATLLVVEVSDTSLDFDMHTKLPMYAAHGIAEVWIVDINGQRVLVHRSPTTRWYADVEEKHPGESLACLAFPDVTFEVNEILPSPR